VSQPGGALENYVQECILLNILFALDTRSCFDQPDAMTNGFEAHVEAEEQGDENSRPRFILD